MNKRLHKKLLIIFVPIFILSLYSGCVKAPDDISEQVLLNVELKFHNEKIQPPPDPSIQKDNPTSPIRLQKSAKLIDAQVLHLTCDGDNDSVAIDNSGYGNNARLFNVEKTSLPNGHALMFTGKYSYAVVNHKPELDGTFGFQISLNVLVQGSVVGKKILLDKHDDNGGYSLALFDGRLRLRIFGAGSDVRLLGRTYFEPGTWYNVSAEFNEEQLSIKVGGEVEATRTFTGSIPASFAPLVFGKSVPDTIRTGDSFIGQMDGISIKTRTEYIDFDEIRIAVMDASKLETENSHQHQQFYMDYENEKWKLLEDRSKPVWQEFKQLWNSFFPVVTDQKLEIKNGYAEGIVNGIDGYNMVSVGAIRNNILLYYGEGFVFAGNDKIATTDIDMYMLD